MPRIRKKTTNRQNTRDRAKIRKHVSEHKRKTAKATKKDVTWKSKKKADPGIPNTFPYKDKVLAELAEEKRQTEEAKLARREASKQKAKAGADDDEEPEDDTPGIQSLSSSSILTRPGALSGVSADAPLEDSDVPDLVDTHLTTLQEVLDKADVLVQVVDARDINGGRSGFVEGLIKDAGGKVVLLINKIDLVPRETLQAWVERLSLPAVLYSANAPSPTSNGTNTNGTTSPSPVLGRSQLLAYLAHLSAEKSKTPSSSDTPSELTAAFMGLPNVGKTSILNSLLPQSSKRYATAAAVPTIAGSKHPEPTTKIPTEVRIETQGMGIRIIDTPGWEYADDDEEEEEGEAEDGDVVRGDENGKAGASEAELQKWDEMEARYSGDLLRRNMGRVDRVKNPVPLANHVITRSNAQDLMLAYNVPYFKEGDTTAFLTSLARSSGRLRKGGSPDLDSAARVLLRDWSLNSFPYFIAPQKAKAVDGMQVDAAKEDQPDMSAVLEKCLSKKEMRKRGKGIVRFQGSEVDMREVILDDDYTAALLPSDDEDEDEDDDDDAEDEDEDEDEEEEELELDEDEEDVEEGELAFTLNDEDGEELDLEDGPEPSSGSDPEGLDDDEEEEEEEEEVEEPARRSSKLKRKAAESPQSNKKKVRTGKEKRVSFAASTSSHGGSGGKGGGGQKRKRG